MTKAKKQTLEEKIQASLNEVQKESGGRLEGADAEDLGVELNGVAAGDKVTKAGFPKATDGMSPVGKEKGNDSEYVGGTDVGVNSGKKVAKTAFPKATDGMAPVGKLAGSEVEDNGSDDAGINAAKSVKALREQIQAVLGEELTLSPEAAQKFTGLFESAVIARANKAIMEYKDGLQEKFDTELLEAIETISEQVDSYVTYATKEWAKDNKVAIEKGIRTELMESFVAGMHTLFTEHYITVPEGKEDLVETLTAQKLALEEKYNDHVKQAMLKESEIADLKRNIIFSQISEGMAGSQSDKLKQLVEGIEYESDTDYATKVNSIRESYFGKTNSTAKIITEDRRFVGTDGNQSAPAASSMVTSIVDSIKQQNSFGRK